MDRHDLLVKALECLAVTAVVVVVVLFFFMEPLGFLFDAVSSLGEFAFERKSRRARSQTNSKFGPRRMNS